MKFKFIGFGGKIPHAGSDYEDLNPETEFWYSNSIDFTVGKVYETSVIRVYRSGHPSEAKFIDDSGTTIF